MSDMGEWVFGNANDTGILGTGHQRFDPYPVNKKSFEDPNYEGNRAKMEGGYYSAQNRQAPAMSSVKLAPASQGTSAQVGALERMQAAQAGPAERMTAAQTGETERAALSQMTAAEIARGEDRQWRDRQSQLADALTAQANGKGVGQDLAAAGYQKSNNQNMKNMMSLLAAQGGGVSPAIAQRMAMDQGAAVEAQNAQNLAADKMRAAMAAQEQLAGVSNAARGQDIGVNTSQAGFIQDANMANMQAANQNSQFNAAQGNDMQRFNAQMRQQASMANMDAGNQVNLANAGFRQQANQFNAGQFNQGTFQNADMAQQMALANLGYKNQFALQQGAMDMTTRQMNLEAQLKQRGMNDEMAKYYSSAMLGLDATNRQAMMDYEALKTKQDLGIKGLEQLAYEAAAGRKSDSVAGLMMAFMGLAASDENVKANLEKVDLDDITQLTNTTMQNPVSITPSKANSANHSAEMDQMLADIRSRLSHKQNSGGGMGDILGSFMSSGGMSSLMAMSDKRNKEDVRALSMSPGDQKKNIEAVGYTGEQKNLWGGEESKFGFTGSDDQVKADNSVGWTGSGTKVDDGNKPNEANSVFGLQAQQNTSTGTPTNERASYIMNLQRQQAPDVPRYGDQAWQNMFDNPNRRTVQGAAPEINTGYSDRQVSDMQFNFARQIAQLAEERRMANERANQERLEAAARFQAMQSEMERQQAAARARDEEWARRFNEQYNNPGTSTPSQPVNNIPSPAVVPGGGGGGGGGGAQYEGPWVEAFQNLPFNYNGTAVPLGYGNVSYTPSVGSTLPGLVNDPWPTTTVASVDENGNPIDSNGNPVVIEVPVNPDAPYGYREVGYDAWNDKPIYADDPLVMPSSSGLPLPEADPRTWMSMTDTGAFGTSGGGGDDWRNKLSDKRQKERITELNDKVMDDFLGKLQAYTYDYKNPDMPGAGHGRQMGVMAQDLEKSEIGRSAVKEVNGIKMVDYGKLGGINMAGLSMVDKRQDVLDERMTDLEKAFAMMKRK